MVLILIFQHMHRKSNVEMLPSMGHKNPVRDGISHHPKNRPLVRSQPNRTPLEPKWVAVAYCAKAQLWYR